MGCPSGRGPCIWTSYVTSVPFCFGLCRCERKECPFLCITCVPLRPEPRPLGAEGPRGVHYGYGVQVGPNVPLNVHRLQYEPQLTRNDRLGGLGGGLEVSASSPKKCFHFYLYVTGLFPVDQVQYPEIHPFFVVQLLFLDAKRKLSPRQQTGCPPGGGLPTASDTPWLFDSHAL